jgi:hypothetical protein
MGRIALLEFWELDVGARQLIERSATSAELLAEALSAGMQPLVLDALEKVTTGRTTLSELQNVLPYDQIRMLVPPASAASTIVASERPPRRMPSRPPKVGTT